MPPLFSFDAVGVATNGQGYALRGVSMDIPDRGISVLVGPSGAGKSTILRLCNRLEVPTAGRVAFRGTDIAVLDPLELRRRVAFIFPTPVLLGGTVADELRLAKAGATDPELAAALGRAELPAAYLTRHGDGLSTGEAQRVCLARALLTDPEVVLADEPTAALDVGLRAGLERLARVLADGGTPIVWVTHDLGQARRLADHLVVVVDGAVAASGAPADVATDPAVVAFLNSDAW